MSPQLSNRQILEFYSIIYVFVSQIAAAVGAGTYYWFDVEGDNVGLFQSCNNWTKECVSMSEKYVGDSMSMFVHI